MEPDYGHPECFEPEKYNPYPLCIGKDKPECKECQLRADWEPDDPYGVERRYLKLKKAEEERNHD